MLTENEKNLGFEVFSESLSYQIIDNLEFSFNFQICVNANRFLGERKAEIIFCIYEGNRKSIKITDKLEPSELNYIVWIKYENFTPKRITLNYIQLKEYLFYNKLDKKFIKEIKDYNK